MIGDAQVFQAQFDCCPGHLDQGILSVACRGVAMEGTAQITPLDQVGKFPGLGCSDFPLILTQLGRDEIEA